MKRSCGRTALNFDSRHAMLPAGRVALGARRAGGPRVRCAAWPSPQTRARAAPRCVTTRQRPLLSILSSSCSQRCRSRAASPAAGVPGSEFRAGRSLGRPPARCALSVAPQYPGCGLISVFAVLLRARSAGCMRADTEAGTAAGRSDNPQAKGGKAAQAAPTQRVEKVCKSRNLHARLVCARALCAARRFAFYRQMCTSLSRVTHLNCAAQTHLYGLNMRSQASAAAAAAAAATGPAAATAPPPALL